MGSRLRVALNVTIFGVLPAIWLGTALYVWLVSTRDRTGFDLRYAFLPAAHDVLNGASPYPLAADPALAHQTAYVYSPFVAFVLSPLTAVPLSVAINIGVLASLALALVTLRVLEVRDWRCYSVALVWAAVDNSALTIAVSVPLALLLALAWRLRDSERRSGALLGCGVAAKVFVWPVLVWSLAMRRWSGLVAGIASAAVLALGSWAVIGFAGLSSYPSLLRKLTSLEESDSYSISGALQGLGVGVSVSRAIALALTGALIGLCVYFGRRGDDRRAFTSAVLAALASTPILWQHYLVLLLVPVAVARPRLSPVWLLPVVLWLSPFTGNGELWQTLLVPACAIAIGAVCLAPERRSKRAPIRTWLPART